MRKTTKTRRHIPSHPLLATLCACVVASGRGLRDGAILPVRHRYAAGVNPIPGRSHPSAAPSERAVASSPTSRAAAVDASSILTGTARVDRIGGGSCPPTRRHRHAPCGRRREVIFVGLVGAISKSSPPAADASNTSGTARAGDIGRGLDLLSRDELSYAEAYYPSSMIDTSWTVRRVVTSVEGDVAQAAIAWRLLGGPNERTFDAKIAEAYEANFISTPESMGDAYYYYHDAYPDGKSSEPSRHRAAILDRGRELSSRMGLTSDAVKWDVVGNSINYVRNENDGIPAYLDIVKRANEMPSDAGFGHDEVYRILSSAGGWGSIFANTSVYRAVRVRRRYRRGYDENSGRRILDCIEVVTTHRVLDGIAGMEYPTSTCKSRMKYTQV